MMFIMCPHFLLFSGLLFHTVGMHAGDNYANDTKFRSPVSDISEEFRQNKILFNRYKGVILEKVGVSYLHHGYSYHLITHSFPKRIIDKIFHGKSVDNHCTIANEMNSVLDKVNKYLNQIVPIKINKLEKLTSQDNDNNSTHSRRKRFLPLLALGATFGLSAWNRYDVSSLKSKVELLNAHMDNLNVHLTTLNQQTSYLIDDNTQIHNVINDQIRVINNFHQEYICSQEHYTRMTDALLYWGNLIPNEYLRALDSALIGKVNPDLIPVSQLREILNNDEELVKSPYVNDISMVYNLASLVILDITTNPHTIKGLLIIPKLTHNGAGEMFSTGSVPFLHDSNTMMQITLPPIVIRNLHDEVYWIPNPVECVLDISVVICPARVTTTGVDLCTTSLQTQATERTCNVLGKQLSEVDKSTVYVVQMRSGVIASSMHGSCKMYRISQDGSFSHITITLRELNATFVTPEDGDHLECNGEVYHIGIHKDEIHIRQLDINITITNSEHEALLDEIRWNRIVPTNTEPLSTIVSTHDISLYTITFILLLLMGATIYYFRTYINTILKNLYTVMTRQHTTTRE